MAARADLMALTIDGLTQLANVGLVKRGLRDLDTGAAPTLQEFADGTVEARFADGTLTRLPAGALPGDAACTCPASGMCRHRVMLVLTYRRDNRAAPDTPDSPATVPTGWDPAALDAEAYEARLSGPARAELARLLAAPMAVHLERGPVPSARLPMASVRFLVPEDIAYARCDCAAETGCAHIGLALRAFRDARGAPNVTVGAAAPAVRADDLVMAVDAVLSGLLAQGAVAGMAAHGRSLDRALAMASRRGATQLVLALEDLADQVSAYEARGARYDERALLRLAAELFARTRAMDLVVALGLGEPMETAMAKTRLVSLGLRLSSQGDEVTAAVLLADTDTGAVTLMEHRFKPGEGEARLDLASVMAGQISPGITVRGLGEGQILTSVARRRADGLLTLGRGHQGKTGLMRRAASQRFPSPLTAASVSAVAEGFTRRPLPLLRPRNRVGDVHVFDVATVLGQNWAAGDQLWQAAVELRDGGGTLFLERSHDAAAPGACAVLFAAAAGRYGSLRQVAGPVRVENGAVVCAPWSLTCDRHLVPDIEDVAGAEAPPPAALDRYAEASVLDRAARLLAGALHAGGRDQDRQESARVVAALRGAGYDATARHVADGLAPGRPDAAKFGQAAVWLTAMLDS